MLHGDRGLRADPDTRAGGTRRPSSGAGHDLPRTSLAQKLFPVHWALPRATPHAVCRLTTERARVVGANWLRLPLGRRHQAALILQRPSQWARAQLHKLHFRQSSGVAASLPCSRQARLRRAAPTALPPAGRAASRRFCRWVGWRRAACTVALLTTEPGPAPLARTAMCSYSPVTVFSSPRPIFV